MEAAESCLEIAVQDRHTEYPRDETGAQVARAADGYGDVDRGE